MAGCLSTCGHKRLVQSYREARDAQEAQAELEGMGYATETASFHEEHPPVTFGWWLQQNRRSP
jgi:hypothetical protein